MKAFEYEEIRTLLLQNDTNPNIFTFIQDRFSSVPFDTFIAISSQEKSRRLRSDYPKLTKPHLVRQYVARYTAGEDVLTISRDSGLPPCLLCRFLFENLLGLNKQQITQCLKDPPSFHGFETNLNSKDNVSITVTKFIQDAEKCMESDQVASPRVEMIRRVTRLELVKACADLVALQWGMEIHVEITRRRLDSNGCVGNALVDMYAKCQRMDIACNLLIQNVRERCGLVDDDDLLVWLGWACQRRLDVVRQMKSSGMMRISIELPF